MPSRDCMVSLPDLVATAAKHEPFSISGPVGGLFFLSVRAALRPCLERISALSWKSLEGKRTGQRPDSKSGAPQGVVGSNPMPSARVKAPAAIALAARG